MSEMTLAKRRDGGLILPNPKHELCKQVCDEIGKSRFEPFVPATINRQQWYAAFVMEVNKLRNDVHFGSVLKGAVNCATLGLMFGEALGHAYLVPFKNRKADNRQEAQLIPGYRGLLELAWANDFLAQVNTELVLRGEEIERWHDANGPQMRHLLPLGRGRADRGNVIGAYCTWKTKLGGTGVEFIERADIDAVDTGKNVWRSDYGAMCRKSAVRRASKYWRISPRLALAVQLDEYAERGEEQPCDALTDDPPIDAAGNMRRVFDAAMSDFGCESASDRESLIRWAVGDPELSSERVVASEELMRAVLARLNQWDQMGHPREEALRLASCNTL